MASPSGFRAVYKVVDEQEIDVDVYLPQSETAKGSARYPVSEFFVVHLLFNARLWIVFLISSLVIDIHGGAFMLGSSDMVNKDQIQDCLNRGWIVLVPNHRLCPQVDLLDGPMRDCRDLLAWVYDGGLQDAVSSETNISYSLDLDHVFAFGTSSGGTLALSLVSHLEISTGLSLTRLPHQGLRGASSGCWYFRHVRPLQLL